MASTAYGTRRRINPARLTSCALVASPISPAR